MLAFDCCSIAPHPRFPLSSFPYTVPSGYSDTVGQGQKCHYSRSVTISGVASVVNWLFGTELMCHYTRIVLISEVTISGVHCNTAEPAYWSTIPIGYLCSKLPAYWSIPAYWSTKIRSQGCSSKRAPL